MIPSSQKKIVHQNNIGNLEAILQLFHCSSPPRHFFVLLLVTGPFCTVIVCWFLWLVTWPIFPIIYGLLQTSWICHAMVYIADGSYLQSFLIDARSDSRVMLFVIGLPILNGRLRIDFTSENCHSDGKSSVVNMSCLSFLQAIQANKGCHSHHGLCNGNVVPLVWLFGALIA